jgi:hypothetical protein
LVCVLDLACVEYIIEYRSKTAQAHKRGGI